MSGISLPVSRPVGRALIVGNPAYRAGPLESLQQIGFQCAELDDPYAAMAELCQRPLVYRALILSLNSIYKEELGMVVAVKKRFPHIDIWLSDTDGRQASLAESLRLGADGLIAEDGLHRIAVNGGPADIPVRRHHPATEAAAGSAPAISSPQAEDLPAELTHPVDLSPVAQPPAPDLAPPAQYPAAALERVSTQASPANQAIPSAGSLDSTLAEDMGIQSEMAMGEPVLTAEELRALLQEQDTDALDNP